METLKFLLCYFLLIVLILILALWADEKWKCRKTIRNNRLGTYMTGYAVLPANQESRTVFLIYGVLGVNSEDLVFEHRFRDSVFPYRAKLAELCSVDVSPYNEHIFSSFALKECSDVSRIRYVVRNIIGDSVSWHIPGLVKKRMLCRITLTDDSAFYFCFKDTERSRETIEKMWRKPANK